MGEAPLIVESPVDRRLTRTLSYLAPEAAFAKLSLAETQAREFRAVPLSERVALCQCFLEEYERTLDASALEITELMGKPIDQARGEFGGMKERTLTLCGLAPEVLADEPVSHKDGFRRFIRHEPLGVVLDIAAWNYPLLVTVNVVVPAILAGNAVLIKHAPQTAPVGAQFESAFLRAGAPPGLVQDLFVDHETAGLLIDSERLGYVAFTGSVAGGRAVHERLGGTLVRSGFELGGKDAALVLDDADWDFAIPNLVDAAFYNAGQSCCALERIYVPKGRAEAFAEAFVEETRRQLRLGDPRKAGVSLGPVVNLAAKERTRAHVDDALRRGARQLLDDRGFDVPTLSDCYLAPQVLDRVPQDSLLMQEETFGPAIAIASYASEEEAVRLVNDSRYGLTASVWTRDLERAERWGGQLRVGTVLANRADYVDPELPWCGVRDSGVGCTLSKYGLLALTQPKSFHLRQSPGS